jgi:alpha-D-ribose 1-methylphosphonate 5-triphosphate diphosphatase
MRDETVITNTRIVTADAEFLGTAVIRDGRIADVDSAPCRIPAASDFEGEYLLPGMVELHTDNLERHSTPRPGVQWPCASAVIAHDAQMASSGITTVFDALRIGDTHVRGSEEDGSNDLAAAIAAAQARGHLRAEHFLHIRCEIGTEDVVARFRGYVSNPLVKLASLMDHTPGQRQFINVAKYREYHAGKYGLSDTEVDALIDLQTRNHHAYSARNRAEIVAACRDRDIPIASHDDATIEHVEEAVADGAVIAEFPTTVEAAAESRARGLKVLMGGPNLVLGRSHSGNVSARNLAEHGHLDILSSDYVPASLLHGAFLLAEECEGISLPSAVAMVSAVPAKAAGLNDRGTIAPGKRADFLRVHVGTSLPLIREIWREGRRVI